MQRPLEVMRTFLEENVSDAPKKLQEFTELQVGVLERTVHALINHCHFTHVEGNSYHSRGENGLVKHVLLFFGRTLVLRWSSNAVLLNVVQDLVD